MKLDLLWVFIYGFLVTPSRGIGIEGDDSSVFTSILKSLSSSNPSPQCPGRCFNALAALACREVIDKPGLCTDPGFRCCKNLSSKDENVPLLTTASDEKLTYQTPEKQNIQNDLETESTIYGSESSINDDSVAGLDAESSMAETIESENEELLQYSAPTSVKVCPGVCVAKRISNFCEAAIDVQGLCKPELRCCVPANLFDGVDNIPEEFVVLNPVKDNKTDERPQNELQHAETFITSSTKAMQSSTSPTIPKPSTEYTTEGTTNHVENNGIEMIEDSGKAPLDDEYEGIPPEKRCKGTCIAGFFSFLCDAIDRSGECPRGGKCCVTQKPTKARPRPHSEEEGSERPNSNKRTSPRPKQRPTTATDFDTTRSRPTTTTTTTITPRTTTFTTTISTEPPPPPCPGRCLPVSVASRCKSPAHLVVASGCSDDEICCDDRKRKKPPQEENSSSPIVGVPQALGTLLSLFGGGPQKSNPPSNRRTMPPRPTTTTTTTTTPSTTTTEAIIIPECPGTCISPILSFTCFGNAEISDLFRCSKDKQGCCAPKSAIREINRVNELNYNIARNDTVFTPPFIPHGPYPQQYPANYEYGPTHYHATPDRVNYPYPSYHNLPPPHQQHLSQHTLHQSHYVTQDQTSLYSHVPQDHVQGGEQAPYPYPPEDHTAYYQHQATYTQNHSAGYPYTSDATTLPTVLSTSSDYLETSPVENKYVCGVKGINRVARVVGGEDAVPGEWCWQVALINSLNQYLCGGALIGTQWVLTAAHCVTNIVRSGDAIYVRVGDHDLTTRYGSPGAQTIPVATTYIHHNHNSQTLDNDIALLKLSSHAELGEGVCLICLPARGVSQQAGKRCIVTGYGYMGETGPIPLRVREAEIPVVSDNECVRKINAVTEKIFILPASSFCAGGESGHDACQGDGGGPLVCNVDNYFELSGLVSWGFGCGRQDVPGVYVKVSSFIGWVNQIIRVNN